MSLLRQIWQTLAERGARLVQLETKLSHCSLEPLYLTKGTVIIEAIERGRPMVITTIRGSLHVKRIDKQNFSVFASPGQPVILWAPGQYSIRARTDVYGLRGEKCATKSNS